MTDHKFTEEQIIKGLEMCGKEEPCEECPYKGTQCLYTLPRDAADLVKRQKAEIERLQGSRDRWKQIATDFDKASRETEKEIERLTTLAELGNMRANDYRAMRDKAKTARAEAIKEFAERLKGENLYEFIEEYYQNAELCYEVRHDLFTERIDTLAKEMTEGQK